VNETRARLERIHFDVVDALRAIEGGRPCPEHILRHMREDARAAAWRMIRADRIDESTAFAPSTERDTTHG
jgi:hypothetical protein